MRSLILLGLIGMAMLSLIYAQEAVNGDQAIPVGLQAAVEDQVRAKRQFYGSPYGGFGGFGGGYRGGYHHHRGYGGGGYGGFGGPFGGGFGGPYGGGFGGYPGYGFYG